ncbi:PEPxxWA-CTERM sorting domain-containing protein [Sphingomonas profundi]|uniref:PEPxxWA-CTERM sorting domain-containing protein n=1 Tax=Alterirhizorhabdus profundi TaxID=2681549 RepID=UPI0012E75896|nr:PEPxxWA-CTERM sorting domain-containing protein [Sphingomonas profundi]
MSAYFKMAIAGAVALLSAAQPSLAASIVNVHFTGPQRTVSEQVGPGVVGSAGDKWNQLFDNQGTASLVDSNNAATGYSITYSAQGTYASDPSYTQFTGTPFANLMQGYLYSSSGPITATISGLNANQSYSLYAITQGDNNTRGRRNDLTVNGQSASNLNTNASSFIAGDNYALFTGRANALGQIVLSDTPGVGEANLNGFQLTSAVPEPTTWAMMIGGFGFVGGAMRRRRSQGHAVLRIA